MSPAIGALVEPLAVAVHAVHQGGLLAGQRVLVVGGGTIGLTTGLAAMAEGADVDLVVRHNHQRDAADALGAGVDLSENYDVAFDAAGTQSALDLAVQHVRPGGSVVAVGLYWEPVTIGLPLLSKEVRLVPAFMYGHHHGAREFVQAAAILTANPSVTDVLVTHRFGLDEAPEAFRVAADRRSGSIKVLLMP